MENKKKRLLWTLAVCAAAVLLVAAVCLIIRYYPQIKGLMQPENMERFRALLDSFGIVGALILIAIQIAQVLSGVIPALPIQLAAGLTYGPFGGLAICMTGIFIGSTIVFLLVKRFGRPLIDRVFSKERQSKLAFLDNTDRLGTVVFILYLIPALPKDVFTYLAALTPLTFRRFICISMVARIPMIFCDTFASGALIEGNYKSAVMMFVVAAILGIFGMLLAPRLAKIFEKRARRKR